MLIPLVLKQSLFYYIVGTGRVLGMNGLKCKNPDAVTGREVRTMPGSLFVKVHVYAFNVEERNRYNYPPPASVEFETGLSANWRSFG
jgi:hypothetical protein